MLHISAKGTSINNINNKINNGIQLDTSSATADGTGSIAVVAGSSTAAADVLIQASSGTTSDSAASAVSSSISLNADKGGNIDLTGKSLNGQTTSVQLTAESDKADITFTSSDKMTARVGNTNTNEVGVSDMNNKPSLVLASTAGSVEVTGSTIVGESDSIQLTAKNGATSGIELESVEQSITLRVGQTTNSDTDDVGGGNIELVSGSASTTGNGGNVMIATGASEYIKHS